MPYNQQQINMVNAARDRATANTPGRGHYETLALKDKYKDANWNGYLNSGGALANAAINYKYGTNYDTSGLDANDWYNAWAKQGVAKSSNAAGTGDTSFLNNTGTGKQTAWNYNGRQYGANNENYTSRDITPQSLGLQQEAMKRVSSPVSSAISAPII